MSTIVVLTQVLFLGNGFYVSPTAVDGTGAAAKILTDGTIHDSIGPVRKLGVLAPIWLVDTLGASDAGQLLRSTGNSATVTLPQNTFTAGDMFTIFNVSTATILIAQGSGVTLIMLQMVQLVIEH